MRVITSQSYIESEIVEEKIEQLRGKSQIVLSVWTTEMQDDNGEDLCILADGHHTYEAAKELGIDIIFNEASHPEGLVGERLLEAAWMDSDYHYLDSGATVW